MDDLGGLGHHSAVLGLDHLDHDAFLGLRDGVAVAAAGAVSSAVSSAAVSSAAVPAAVSAGQTAGVAAVIAACTFHGITAVARY